MTTYNEQAHDRALAELDRRWEQMHRAAQTEGRGSATYKRLRQDVIVARRIVRLEAGRGRRRG